MEEIEDYVVGDEVIIFGNVLSVHRYSDHQKSIMDAKEHSRFEDFDTWFRLKGKPEHIWFSKIGDRFVGFDSKSNTNVVANPYHRKDRPKTYEFKFRTTKLKITLNQVMQLWDSREEVTECWDRPTRVQDSKPTVKTMYSSMSMVSNGKILTRGQVKKLVADWNESAIGFRFLEDVGD